MKSLLIIWWAFLPLLQAFSKLLRQPIPDRLVVLTFDDAVSSHVRFVAPLLKKYGFGGTFFVCEFPPDFDDKQKYMSWDEIRQLHEMGFEIANHTATHVHVSKMGKEQFTEQLKYIEDRCKAYGIPKPVSFAYPGYETHPSVVEILQEKGYLFARIGGSRAYQPTADHPYLIPSFSTTGTDTARIIAAIQQARNGKIVVLTIHGVPDDAHPQVTTPPRLFEQYLQYLYDHHYKVIALCDLAAYIDMSKALKQLMFNDKNVPVIK